MPANHPMPSLFLSHGAPDMVITEKDARDALRTLATRLPRPSAIVVVSAHWSADPLGVTAGDRLRTIHDFGGFPAELYALQYPAQGSQTLSNEIKERLHEQGFVARLDTERGLDHGAWIPLMIMYPDAEIPVVQVSLPAGSLNDLVRLGTALRPLCQRGVLVIGSGGSVHNLRALNQVAKTDDWAVQFEHWLRQTVEGNHFSRLITTTDFPTSFRRAHPTIEHYAPLVVAWAAGDRDLPGRRVHHGFTYGNLGMSCFEFGYQTGRSNAVVPTA